jgi:hypothetical protein
MYFIALQAAYKELKAHNKAVAEKRRAVGRGFPDSVAAAEAALLRLQEGAESAQAQPQVWLSARLRSQILHELVFLLLPSLYYPDVDAILTSQGFHVLVAVIACV